MAKAKRQASKRPAAKKATKRAPVKKSAVKKSAKTTKKQSARRAPVKTSKVKKTPTKAAKKSSGRRPKAPPTAYEKRNANARALGYESYWDERQSRLRAREALGGVGHPTPNATDPETLKDVDELATLGRGDSARELYYKTKRILEKYEPAPSDRQIWSLIRIFYKPRGRR